MNKIFFIHVAKTAGSSFNAFLSRYLNGEDHCEKYLNSYGFISEFNRLRSLDYISGHLQLNVFNKNGFPRNDYFLVTFLRNPIDQLISHINWISGLYDLDSSFFNSLHTDIQAISREIRELNLYDTDTFISTLERFRPLFGNYQSSYFANDSYTVSSSFVIENLLQFDMVGLTEYYEKSLGKFIELSNLEAEVKLDRENVNCEYKIGKDILENELIREFIQSYNFVDMSVYNYFLARSGFYQ